MKPEVGFLGLGVMGKWMALNLIKAGFPLKFFARKKAVIEEIVAHGGQPVQSPRDLAAAAAWIFLCLPDTATVREILLGQEGMAERLAPGQVIVDCSTIHPLETRAIARGLQERGVPFLDAPVSGMESRAKSGTLTIMVGGEEPAFQRVEPALRAMGNNILYLGGSGNGQLMKLTNQLLLDIHCAAFAEVLPLAVKMGLDPEQVIAAVHSGTGQSFALDNFGPQLLDGNFNRGYSLENAYKDMMHAAEISSARRIPLPVTSAAMLTYQMALATGLGGENKAAMIKIWEEKLGVRVRKAVSPKKS